MLDYVLGDFLNSQAAQVSLHSMAFFEAALHYHKRHNALEDATWQILFEGWLAMMPNDCWTRAFFFRDLILVAVWFNRCSTIQFKLRLKIVEEDFLTELLDTVLVVC